MAKTEWLALSYTAPASPSKVRVYIWRRLRQIGAQQLRPGLAVLPNTRESLESFCSIAEKLRGFGGEATVIEMDFADDAESREMRKRFSLAREQRLREALRDCNGLMEQIGESSDPAVRARLEKELRGRISELGDSSPPMQQQASEIERAAAELLEALRGLPAELSAILKSKK